MMLDKITSPSVVLGASKTIDKFSCQHIAKFMLLMQVEFVVDMEGNSIATGGDYWSRWLTTKFTCLHVYKTVILSHKIGSQNYRERARLEQQKIMSKTFVTYIER